MSGKKRKAIFKIVRRYAKRFKLPLRKLEALGPRRPFYGDCDSSGRIRIRIRQFAYQLVDTISHELAHLRHPDHSPKWFRLHLRIQRRMQKDRVYQDLRRILNDYD